MTQIIRPKKALNTQFSNIKFNFEFFLECNQEGKDKVITEIKNFIEAKNWATSTIETTTEYINS